MSNYKEREFRIKIKLTDFQNEVFEDALRDLLDSYKRLYSKIEYKLENKIAAKSGG